MSFERDQNRNDAAEAAIERLLKASSAVTPAGNCLDAETAAAWAERRLLPRELTAVEAHVSDCRRCQELIALIARTTPGRETTETAPLGTRWRLGWLVPVAAAAAALVIWVAVGREAPVLQQQTAQEYNAAPAAEPSSSARNDRTLTDKADVANPEQAARDALAASPALQKSTRAEARQESVTDAAPSAKEASVPPASPAQSTTPSAAAAPPPSAARSRADTLLRAARVPIEIVSPDGSIRWRVVPGSIQRSTDGGSTWTAGALDPAVDITAGVSPAPGVCWLVGRGGLVMLTDDGAAWRRLMFPAVTDLVSVRATTARAATVIAADGRQFETTDAGASWR